MQSTIKSHFGIKKDKHFLLILIVLASVYLREAERRDSEPSEFTHLGERHSHSVSLCVARGVAHHTSPLTEKKDKHFCLSVGASQCVLARSGAPR